MNYKSFNEISFCSDECSKKECYKVNSNLSSQLHAASQSKDIGIDFDSMVRKKRRKKLGFCNIHNFPKSVDSLTIDNYKKIFLIEFKHVTINSLKNLENDIQQKIEHTLSMLVMFLLTKKIKNIYFILVYGKKTNEPNKYSEIASNQISKIKQNITEWIFFEDIKFDAFAVNSDVFDKKSKKFSMVENQKNSITELFL